LPGALQRLLGPLDADRGARRRDQGDGRKGARPLRGRGERPGGAGRRVAGLARRRAPGHAPPAGAVGHSLVTAGREREVPRSARWDRATGGPAEYLLGRQVLRKVTRRLLPFLCLLYFVNILARVNIGFARLHTMLADLGMSEKAYALGAGIFFVGYCLLE